MSKWKRQLEEYDNLLEEITKIKKGKRELKFEDKVASVEVDIGWILKSLDRHEEAIEHLKAAKMRAMSGIRSFSFNLLSPFQSISFGLDWRLHRLI